DPALPVVLLLVLARVDQARGPLEDRRQRLDRRDDRRALHHSTSDDAIIADTAASARSMASTSRFRSSGTSGRLARGSSTRFTPARSAASSFARTPPTGRISPVKVSSPVTATSLRTARPLAADTIATS